MDPAVPYSLMFLDITKFLVFFLTSYFFSTHAIDFLPHGDKWLIGLKVFLVAGLTVQLVTASLYIIYGIPHLKGVAIVCTQPMLMMMRISNELMIFIFFILGIFITREVMKFHRDTVFEKTEYLMSQKCAIRKLWIIIS